MQTQEDEEDEGEADIEDGDRVDEEDEGDDEDESIAESRRKQFRMGRKGSTGVYDQAELPNQTHQRREYIEDGDTTPPQRQGAISSYEVLKKKYHFNQGAATRAITLNQSNGGVQKQQASTVYGSKFWGDFRKTFQHFCQNNNAASGTDGVIGGSTSKASSTTNKGFLVNGSTVTSTNGMKQSQVFPQGSSKQAIGFVTHYGGAGFFNNSIN